MRAWALKVTMGHAVNWPDYKRLCDRPDVVSRFLLEQTAEVVVDVELAKRLRGVLATAPIAKPEGHRGPPASDMFLFDLDADDARAIVAYVQRAIAAGRATSATRGRGLGGFLDAWLEIERFLERRLNQHGERTMAKHSVESLVTGKVWKVQSEIGQHVNEGDVLLILESMKMEIPIESPASGRLIALNVAEEQAVTEGEVLAIVEG